MNSTGLDFIEFLGDILFFPFFALQEFAFTVIENVFAFLLNFFSIVPFLN